MDDRNDEFLIASFKFLISTTIWGILYSIIRKIPQLKLKEQAKEENNSIFVAFASSLIGPILTCVLLGISLLSLYIKKKKLLHPPFLLGAFSSILILLGKYYEKTVLSKFVLPGNILMIISAIWNARINKFSGLPIYNKN